MSHSANSENSELRPQPPRTPRSRWLIKVFLGTSAIAGLGALAGGWWVSNYVNERLTPQVEQSLERLINREVEIGDVQSWSFSHITFGESTLPATTTDPDTLTIESLRVRFNLLQVVFERKLSMNLHLQGAQGYFEQNADLDWLDLELTPQPAGTIEFEVAAVTVQDSALTLEPFTPPEANPYEAIQLTDIVGRVRLRDTSEQITFSLAGQVREEGDLKILGSFRREPQVLRVSIQANDLRTKDISHLAQLPPTLDFQSGQIGGNVIILNREAHPLLLQGVARIEDADFAIQNVPQSFSDATGLMRFQGQEIQFDQVALTYGELPGIVNGAIHLKNGYDLQARLEDVPIALLWDTFGFEPPVATEGNLQADLSLEGALNRPLLSGAVRSQGIAQVDRVLFQQVATEFALRGPELTFTNIQARPQAGGLITGDGQILLGESRGLVFDLAGQDLPGDPLARTYGFNSSAIALGAVDADVQVFGPLGNLETIIDWQAHTATYPGQGEIAIANGVVQLRNTVLQVADGTIRGRGRLAEGLWEADVQAEGVQLRRFSPMLQGSLGGDLRLTGSLDQASVANTRAEGTVNFSDGLLSFSELLADFNQPLTAEVVWDGEKIQVLEANADRVTADGAVYVQLQGEGAPAIERLALNVDAQGYALTSLPVSLPYANLTGTADFEGQVTGPLSAINLVGDVQLNQAQVNNLAFDPTLVGTIRFGLGSGLDLDLQGPADSVLLRLAADNRPQELRVVLDDAISTGRSSGDDLMIGLENLRLDQLALPPAGYLGSLGGEVDAQLTFNWLDRSLAGSYQVAAPRIGYIELDDLQGNFRYADGSLFIPTTTLSQGESVYQLQGRVTPGAEPLVQGSIQIEEGRLQDVLAALRIFELEDLQRGLRPPIYDGAASLDLIGVGFPGDVPILRQLRRLAEIDALLAQQRLEEANASRLPPLSELTGEFSGTIENIAWSPRQGLQMEFDLDGENWVWDRYQINDVVAQGNLEQDVLTLQPLRLVGEDDLLLSFRGRIGGEDQTGQLEAQNLPVALVRDFVDLPVDLEGDFGVLANLSGSFDNPNVVGSANLSDASINDTEIRMGEVSFRYADAVIGANGNVVVGKSKEPLTLQARIPYQFPFVSVAPATDEVFVQVDVRNEGLAFLNAFTDQVEWIEGQGLAQLQITGAPTDLSVLGDIQVQDAVLASQTFPTEPFTNVDGQIQFSRDRIMVEQLRGDFSQGEIYAAGVIPLFRSLPEGDPDLADPLTIAMRDIDINFKGLYNGGVGGQVFLLGTALAPQLQGDVILSNGQFFLPDQAANGAATETAANGSTPDGTDANANAADAGLTDPNATASLRFRDLNLQLGDNVEIRKEPILAFIATGNILLNGSLNNLQSLRPEGTIELQRGQVNLFTSRFRLTNDYPQTATFRPNLGLNPLLDIQLITSATEVTRAPIQDTTSPTWQGAIPFASTEVQDVSRNNVGELQTVRIYATVTGLASELFENIELTSSPSRSEAEIVSLIGGGFVDTLGRSDSTLAIANLAGSTLFGGIQDAIGTAIGLSEFRLFPTYVTSDDSQTSALALGAELGIDITDDLSASVVQILTGSEDATRFGLRYRINDEFLLRGSTNLDNDSRLILEYETRF
ncbi:MAG: translocation/assembly module TamB domain-containing protein [Thainema sp.]